MELVPQSPRVQLFIVTVNWKQPHDTCECLDYLQAQQGVAAKIIVVDNGSGDDSLQIISKRFPNIQLIQSDKNLGFAGGFNLGIRSALYQGATHILIINNDTVASPSMCNTLMAEMQSKDIGVSAPIIFYSSQPCRVWSGGGNINHCILEPRDPHGRNYKYTKPEIRTFLSGCCLMVKRDVFEKVGLFDERFFLYYEDLDFCLRVFRAHLQMIVVPKAKLWHKVSKSSGGEVSANERFFMARSSGLYFKKHMRFENALFIIAFRFGSAIIWSIRLIIAKNWHGLKAYWRGLFAGWFGI